MLLGWNTSRCIICLNEATLTLEHVIPRSLGGVLTARILCKPCNDALGHREEAQVKQDPAIKIAIEQIKSSLPDYLAREMTEGQDYFAKTPAGPVRGSIKNAVFKIKSGPRPDGSIVLSTGNGRDLIEKHLDKVGVDAEAIREKLRDFDMEPEDSSFPIDRGLRAVKWSVGAIQPTLDGRFLSDAVILKIAYEFLACVVGKAIYSDTPALIEARRALRGERSLSSKVRIEHLRGPKYDAFHGVAFQGNEPHAVIQIRLFGWLAFKVYFGGILINAPRLQYTHRLDRGADSWDKLPWR